MKVKDLLKNVENVELTPEQEKQIKDYLGIKDNKRFKPKQGEKYYYIYPDLSLANTHYDCGFSSDRDRVAYGNCFKTSEEAKFAAEQIKVYQELKNFAEENNDPMDWEDPMQDKTFIMYDYNLGGLRATYNCWQKALGTIYFSSNKLAEQAIKKVGEDRIKKYLFGVE